MIDPFVILAPVLLLAVVALLGFIGCAVVAGLEDYATAAPTAVDLSLSPKDVTLGPSETQAFTTNTDVTWEVDGVSPSSSTPRSFTYTAPASIPTGPDTQKKITATSVAGSKSESAIVHLWAIRVNAGAVGLPAYTDPQGQVWNADDATYFSGGNTSPYSTTKPIANTPTPLLYQTCRFLDDPTRTSFKYQFAVPNGNYTVTLKFAEIFFQSPASGSRKFNVAINDTVPVRLLPLDIAATAVAEGVGDAFTAVDVPISGVSVTGGQITIEFIHVLENPQINAIEMIATKT